MPVRDYIRVFRQEYKVLAKHGAQFLQGSAIEEILTKRLKKACLLVFTIFLPTRYRRQCYITPSGKIRAEGASVLNSFREFHIVFVLWLLY